MIYALDVYYYEKEAKTVCIGFKDWTSEEYDFVKEIISPIEGEYKSGEFYKRELPCIQSMLKEIALSKEDIIVLDGYVYLSDEKELGLGGRLYESLNKEVAIVGVAKSNFSKIRSLKKEVMRGKSHKALYVTSAGIDLEAAAANIKQMKGDYRIPDLLKKLDMLTKN